MHYVSIFSTKLLYSYFCDDLNISQHCYSIRTFEDLNCYKIFQPHIENSKVRLEDEGIKNIIHRRKLKKLLFSQIMISCNGNQWFILAYWCKLVWMIGFSYKMNGLNESESSIIRIEDRQWHMGTMEMIPYQWSTTLL